MLVSSPSSKRIVSPSSTTSKRLVSPRGNFGRNQSGADLFCAGFLRYFKWLLAGLVGIAVVRLTTIPATPTTKSPSGLNSIITPDNPSYFVRSRISSFPDTSSTTTSTSTREIDRHNYNSADKSNINHIKSKRGPGNLQINHPKKQKRGKLMVHAGDVNNITRGEIIHIQGDKDRPSQASQKQQPQNKIDRRKRNKQQSEKEVNKDDYLSYKASNAPVILDGWNRTVQVHLIVDVTGSAEIDPASKLLHAAVERSEYTQLSAVTFVRPSMSTIEVFPQKLNLPFLYLIDWGSMERDCHRLQLVLENLREQERENKNRKETAERKSILSFANKEEIEESYLLLVDFSGSTRQTGCNNLFATTSGSSSGSGSGSGSGSSEITHARTNDKKRIRLAKRSIVQNRYYDHTSKEMHNGELLPNNWDDVPSDYDKPILHSPIALRESFVMSIQNITNGKPVSRGLKRDTDVGYFWKSGDYSHYGFYRRDVAKVVKTLHHSTLDKKIGKLMENQVQIVYSDEKGMEAGNVQFKYTWNLLNCKIVVITQRDEWEDHYRLMESLASGALVMTDPMIAPPAGLIDKVNIVVYDNPKTLKNLIKYFLKPENEKERKRIAYNGYQLVMGRHRCWHRLEELLFGRPLTNIDQPNAPAPEKENPPESSYRHTEDTSLHIL